jgi:vanillate O-demethylase monooxygenase subunit
MSTLPTGFLPEPCTYTASDWQILSRYWYPVARAGDIAEKPVAATLLDVELVIYRTPAGIAVARDLCPHRGVPLSMGCVEGDELICAYHGLRYGPDGGCRKIPAQPDLKPPEKFRLTVFPVVERYGLVWTCLRPDDPEPAVPPFPAWTDAHYQPILPPPVDIAGSPGRQVEGFIDVAHFAFIHDKAFADRDNAVVPSYQTETTDYGIHTDYWSSVSNYPKSLRHLEPPGFRWLRAFDVYPPFAARLSIHFPEGALLHILNLASPVSARRTRLFVPIARNFDTSGSLEDVYAFNAQIFAEDQAIIERQRPADLPLDAEMEAHFAADRTSVYYRRLLKSMGLTLKFAG